MVKLFFRFIGKYKICAFLGALAKLIESTIELAFPLIIANIIDYGLKAFNQEHTIEYSVILFILAIFSTTIVIVGQFLAAVAGNGVGANLRNELFFHIQKLSSMDKGKLGSSSIVTRLNNDVTLIERTIAMFIRLVFRAPIICIGGIVLTLMLDVPLSLVIIGFVPVLLVFVVFVLRQSVKNFKKTQLKLDKIALDVKENITGLRVIKAFDKTNDEKESFNNLNNQWRNIGVKSAILANTITPFTTLVMNLAITLIIFIGAQRIDSGNLSQGELIAFITYVNLIINALIWVTNLTNNISKAIASSSRVLEVLNCQPSMLYGQVASWDDSLETNAIEYCNAEFAFGKKKVVTGLNFAVKKGMTLGVLGGTGSGKSTFASLTTRLLDVTSGQILINGVNIKDYDKETLRHHVGVVFQNDSLISGTIYDNIKMDRNISDEAIFKSLEVAQVANFVSSAKGKLNYKITEGSKNLSGGQKQRLTIARALAGNPDILILDDSFSALDYLTDFNLRQSLKTEYPNCTKIFISQRISAIKDADLIIVLEKGEVVGIGQHDYLLQNCPIYQEIDASQKKVKV